MGTKRVPVPGDERYQARYHAVAVLCVRIARPEIVGSGPPGPAPESHCWAAALQEDLDS
jgi:hypothetical protein